ncbi:MAG: 1-acyl-sn-glycerol-3-phosphate acyltransferase [Hyphomicrobiales bacterium]|nr:1-acyl-sn-glycerol-3-phosphate acyltransferase [Hyphomicrobiales bacterium]
MNRVVAVLALARLAAITAVALPTQMAALRFGWPLARTLPGWWHRRALGSLGVRIREHGAPATNRPLLVTPNHCSWLDIPVIGSLMPISFVAKAEVATWPLFGLLAKLQRSVFVDRTRRTATGRAADELGRRLADGDCMVLFPEGTSSTGDVVLPFRSALLGAARGAIDAGGHAEVWVQPMSVAYTRIAGMPMGRADRPRIGWTGDVDLPPHLWGVVTAGGIDVEIVWGEPRPFDARTDRKALAASLEREVRAGLLARLRP